MILETAKNHFYDDLKRTRAILDHADGVADTALKKDLCRSGWMFGVGALDAYFSDAFGDLIARTLRAMHKQPLVTVPDRLQNLKLPAAAVIRPKTTEGWRWRMAARELIEDDNVLSIEKIRSLFNQFFPNNNKLFGKPRIEAWIKHPDATSHLFGITTTEFNALASGTLRNKAVQDATEHMEARFEKIFQRRHDCIHNCDRPKTKPQSIHGVGTVRNVVRDIEFLVKRTNEALVAEYPKYLERTGFNAVTRNIVGASK